MGKINYWLKNLKNLPKNTYLCWKYPFLKFYSDKNKIFHISSWYDCIPKGWKKSFGMQMIKEISDSLIRYGGKNAVKKYQILDIKEKYGTLHWYDYRSTIEIHKIIYKYEQISEHTCISCGRVATVQSTGWICPYCNDCIGDKNHIHFGHKSGPSWYGWNGNIDSIPEEIWNEEEEFLNKT